MRLIASSGTGYDGIDVAAARELGIAVTNSPGAAAECVADTAWSLMLATVRRTVVYDRYVRAGSWLHGAGAAHRQGVGRAPRASSGSAPSARRSRAAPKASAMDIAYHGRHRQTGRRLRATTTTPVDLARDVKILVVAMPGRDETRGLVSRDVIDALGPAGYLVNVSRGSVVDEPYLVDALVQGGSQAPGSTCSRTSRACREALLALDNVVLQPHAGSGTQATRDAIGQFVVDNLAAFFAGRPLVSPV